MWQFGQNHVLRPDHDIRQRQWCSRSTERMPEWKLVDAMGLQFKRWSGRECRLKDGLVTSLMWRDPSTINPQISRKHSISRKNWIKQSNINQWTKRSQKMVPETVHSETQAPRDIAKKNAAKAHRPVDWISWNWPTSSWIHEHKQTNWLFELLWCEIKLKHQLVMDIWAHSSERYSKWTESWQDRSNHRISKHRHAQEYSKERKKLIQTEAIWVASIRIGAEIWGFQNEPCRGKDFENKFQSLGEETKDLRIPTDSCGNKGYFRHIGLHGYLGWIEMTEKAKTFDEIWICFRRRTAKSGLRHGSCILLVFHREFTRGILGWPKLLIRFWTVYGFFTGQPPLTFVMNSHLLMSLANLSQIHDEYLILNVCLLN